MLSMQNYPVYYLVMLTCVSIFGRELEIMPKYHVLYKNVKYRDSFTIVIVFSENIVTVIFSLSPSSKL